jgi:anaphase-promoting complex subunit 1
MADTYEHLAPGHDPTTVGLLVGLGAARAGSGDAAVSKTLCLHVPALLPPAFHELDVGAIVQTAALVRPPCSQLAARVLG